MFVLPKMFIILMFFFFIIGCSSTSNTSTRYDEVPNLQNQQDSQRFNSVKIGYQNVGKLISFYLNDEADINHICLTDSCRQDYIKWPKTVHIDRSFKYSPTLQTFSTNHLGVCGKGDGHSLVKNQRQNTFLPSTFDQLSQLLREIPAGSQNWNTLYNDQCYSDYFPGNMTNKVAEVLACTILLGTCIFTGNENVLRITEYKDIRFKNDILNSGADLMLKIMQPQILNLIRNNVEQIKVVSLDKNKANEVLETQVEQLSIYKTQFDGLIILNKHSRELIGEVYFNELTNNDRSKVQQILKQFERSMQESGKASDNNFIATLIPPKVNKPILPPIPYLVKDEFEKIADFEKRVELAARERQAIVREINDNYKLSVYKRNTYIKALEVAYAKHLEDKSNDKLALQKLIVDNKQQFSRLLMKLLYSDSAVRNISYDAEDEKLYASIYSQRNKFQQLAVFDLKPPIAKQIKSAQNLLIGLNISEQSNGVSISGTKLLFEEELYDGDFTDIQFEPINMFVEVQTTDPSFKEKQNDLFTQYIQKQTYLPDLQADDSYNVVVRTKFNRRKPNWFEQQPDREGVTFVTGESSRNREDAILKAKAILAGFIQADIKAVTNSRQAVSGSVLIEDSFSQEIIESSDVDLGQYNVKMIRESEIDGWHYVLLRCLCNE